MIEHIFKLKQGYKSKVEFTINFIKMAVSEQCLIKQPLNFDFNVVNLSIKPQQVPSRRKLHEMM